MSFSVISELFNNNCRRHKKQAAPGVSAERNGLFDRAWKNPEPHRHRPCGS